jgi:glycosyltransferase involved in cell wall biosynthesis
MTVTVSVLMTAYNRERYIAAAIESVLAQTFTDIELIIVDDDSTDATVAIARRYEQLDPRVHVHVNPVNLGDYANRNHAARLARGRYLKYHDSDDLMYPHCLKTMVQALDAEPRAGFAMTTAWAWPGGPSPMLSTPRMSYQREFLGFGLFMCGPSCGLFRRDVFRALGGFDDIGVASDYAFWLKACARYSALLVYADLFWYRQHAGQELHSRKAARQYAELPRVVWAALHAPDCPLERGELGTARRNFVWTIAKQSYRDLRRGRFGLAFYRYRRAGVSLLDWMRYLRRPRRHALAGTPLGPDGDVLIPAALGLTESADR